jgi:hypothetical protein
MINVNFFRSKVLAWSMLAAVSLLFFPHQALALAPAGSMTGFIYADDMKSPVEGAVVKLRDVGNGKEFQSTFTDKNGLYEIKGIPTGRYIVGVSSQRGDFNFDYQLVVKANETANLSLALKPFEAGAQGAPNPQEGPTIRGEKWVGKIISYDASIKEAQIYINRGQLKMGESFHVKGDKQKYNSDTDFWQTVKYIRQRGLVVNKAVAGQYYNIPLDKPALFSDFIYIKESGGLAAFFTSPLGIATIVTSTAVLAFGVYKLFIEEEEKSPSKR